MVTDILVLRGIVALVLMIGIPLFVSDKVLSRMKSGLGGSERLGIVLDVFGVFWMALAWLFVGALPRVFVAEGDRQTRNGSISFAKATYLLGGVSPTFRMERSLVAAASSSVSTPGGGTAGSGPAATDASPPQGDR